MGVTGDFKELQQLRRRLGNLGGPGFMLKMSRGFAETSRERITHSFQESQDPYGRTWKASFHGRGPEKGSFKTVGQILRDTNRLFRSLVPADITAQGFAISTSVKYAAIHQYGGTITLPERRATLVHGKRGRFLARSKAAKRKGSTRVSFATYYARSFRMPRRQYMPDGGRMGPLWRSEFFKTARRIVSRHMAQGAADAR